MIIVLHGLPGVGKSTLSEKLEVYLDGISLGTNKIRKQVLEHKAYEYGSTDTFPFSREEVYHSYKIMLYCAELLASTGKHVILDATFQKRNYVDMAKVAAKRAKTGFFVLEVICDEHVCKARIEKRILEKKSDSIVGYEHHLEMKEKIFEKYPAIDFTFNTAKPHDPQWLKLKKALD